MKKKNVNEIQCEEEISLLNTDIISFISSSQLSDKIITSLLVFTMREKSGM